jgi:hypothetical protein
MRKIATTLATGVLVAAALAAAGPADAATGHPVGGCATAGGWILAGYVPENGSAVAVDQTYGNNDGWLCVKYLPDAAPFPILVDNTVPPAGSR